MSDYADQPSCNNIGAITYHHRYYPTRFDAPNVPWYPQNMCPFANVQPTSLPTIFPPYAGTTMYPFAYDPIHGIYGTPSEPTLKGYTKSNNTCSWGFYPVNIDGQTAACCNMWGECGIENTRIK